jgi:hypothetical protein
MSESRRWTVALILILTLGACGLFVFVRTAASDPFDPTCGTYSNSSVQYQPGYGGYCGGSGGTCGECSSGYPGGHTVCVSDNLGLDICTDYQW